MSNISSQKQTEYEDLFNSIEAGTHILNVLLVHCGEPAMRDHLIADYEAELESDICRYRVELPRAEESVRLTVANLVKDEPCLREGGKAVVTVIVPDDLRDYKLPGEERSEQEIFLGFLQWTREALREFKFAIVLWVTPQVGRAIADKAPDFHHWCKGVFRF